LFGIGGPELIVILIVALLLVGPDKLPQVARTVGTGLRDLRRAANMAQSELRETMEELTREVDLEGKRDQHPPVSQATIQKTPHMAMTSPNMAPDSAALVIARRRLGPLDPGAPPPEEGAEDGALPAIVAAPAQPVPLADQGEPTAGDDAASAATRPLPSAAAATAFAPVEGAVARSAPPRRTALQPPEIAAAPSAGEPAADGDTAPPASDGPTLA
jgi:Tat protein translocase TatB subunit